MGRTNKRTRRRSRGIRTQPKFPPQRRTSHSVVPVDHADDGNPDNEFVHDDDWLEPYERTEEAP